MATACGKRRTPSPRWPIWPTAVYGQGSDAPGQASAAAVAGGRASAQAQSRAAPSVVRLREGTWATKPGRGGKVAGGRVESAAHGQGTQAQGRAGRRGD